MRCGIFLIIFLTFLAFTDSYAQEDVKADSTLIEELRQYPRPNSLPVRRPILSPEHVELETAASLDVEVNYWRNWLAFGINVNQAAFSSNWGGGGVNSLALGGQFTYKTDYTREERNFVSEVILQYGKVKNKDQLSRKSNDRIFWDNKLALRLSKNWYFFGSINFESQFDRGYSFGKDAQGNEFRTLLSSFMAPGYITESLGFEYKREKYFFLRIGTGTARQTFVLDTTLYKTNPKNFGVEPGKSFRNELAFQIVASFDRDIAKNLNLKSRYTMFANYEQLSNIDNRLDLTLTAQVNRLINVQIAGVALYDHDTADKLQASQALSLGLLYKFPR